MPAATETASIDIRDVSSVDEIKAIEHLQIEAWGDDEREIVPLNQLAAARHVGGTLIGAFDGSRIVGFAYGFYGHIGGRIVHHSHMLAVSPDYRRHDLGFRLKAAQRTRVLADRLTDRITWTFDPLQSLNAHFNFAKLRVVADTYKIDIYGEQGASFLHRNGTDRFFVTWLLESPRVRAVRAGGSAKAIGNDDPKIKPLTLLRFSSEGAPERCAEIEEARAEHLVSVEIPADINAMERSDFDLARKWRVETRSVFSRAIAEGFVVTDYFLENERSGSYILEKTDIDRLAQ